MKLNSKIIIQTIIFTLLGVGLIYWRYTALSATDRAAMFEAFQSFRWAWALPIFIVGVLSHYVRAKRWELQFEALNIPYQSKYTFNAVIFGYMTNIIVPRLGEVTKCTYIAKKTDADVDKVIGTVIAERIWDMICFIILAFITLLLQIHILLPYATDIWKKLITNIQNADGSLMWGKVVLLLIIILTAITIGIVVFRKYRHTKIGKFLDGVQKGLQSIYQVKQKGKFLFHTIALWLLYTLVAVMVLKAIPSTEHLPLLSGLSIITFGTFAMVVPAPGSIAYPVIVAPILTLYGTSMGVGQGFGWINWANQNLTIIILSLLIILISPFINTTKNDAKI